ncbi:MAG: hypothetical protein IT357_12155 [Gemmatimonadaceae bacterium]|nr:hypothetical protein [Gemmatimonadaceae bacterium]
MNVIIFLVAFWTSVIYGFMTRDLLGSALWMTMGFAALTSARLTPPRIEDELELEP